MSVFFGRAFELDLVDFKKSVMPLPADLSLVLSRESHWMNRSIGDIGLRV